MTLDPKLEKILLERLEKKKESTWESEKEIEDNDLISVVITAEYNEELEPALEELCVEAKWLGPPSMGLISAKVPVSNIKDLQEVNGVESIELDDIYTIQ